MDCGDTRIANAESIEQTVVVQRMAAGYAQQQGGFVDNEQVGIAKAVVLSAPESEAPVGRCVVS